MDTPRTFKYFAPSALNTRLRSDIDGPAYLAFDAFFICGEYAVQLLYADHTPVGSIIHQDLSRRIITREAPYHVVFVRTIDSLTTDEGKEGERHEEEQRQIWLHLKSNLI